MKNRPTLRRIGRQLWRIGRRLYYTHTHTPILEESVLESPILQKSVCGYGPLVDVADCALTDIGQDEGAPLRDDL